jgi:transcription elongation factor Elf1
MKEKEKYNCPICGVEMSLMVGESIHPNNSDYGVMLYCGNRGCSAQEVMGHGDKVKDAYEVVMHKYSGGYRQEKEDKKGS